MSGSLSQALGLAQAMGIEAETHLIRLQRPWTHLPISLHPRRLSLFECPAPPWPDLLIASAKGTIAPALAVKKAHPQTHVVYLQNPGRRHHRHFDTVIAPSHDGNLPNAIQTLGAPHRASPARIQAGLAALPDTYKRLTSPIIGVLIGGNARSHRLDATATEHLISSLNALALLHKATLIFLPSRRTPKASIEAINQAFEHTNHIVWDTDTPSPYLGILGLADAFVITEESVSMISEAAGTGKPIHLFPLTCIRESKRMKAFHNEMIRRGFAKWFNGQLPNWSYSPLNETMRAAELLTKKINNTTPY